MQYSMPSDYWCLHVNPSVRGGRRYREQLVKFGERGSGLRQRGEPQDFQKLRAKCLREGRLFEDPDFPAEDASLFYSRQPPKPFQWMRPSELSEEPRLFVEGASRFDVQQGELGDCWLLAAVANLTLNQSLFTRVVPDDQSFVEDYAGIFHFRFWQYGRWIDVVVDDRLPTYYNHLVFMHSQDSNEFWSALLEKAYAKLHGSYEALKGGTTCEAMEDFTGGVTEVFELATPPSNLFSIMLKAYERSSLMGCSIEPDPNITEAELANGLIRGHAYSITRVKLVDIQTPRTSGKIPLIRIRNPWGNASEWKGSWSDSSPEWRYIPEGEKQELGLTFSADGEFWMSFQDFVKNFQRLELCNLNPDSLDDDPIDPGSSKKWECNVFEGSWVKGVTSGGCRNFLDTFWYNPQYRVVLEDADDDDDDNCTVIIGLMQKNRRTMRKMGVECLTIGFSIYLLKNPDDMPKPLDKKFFQYNASTARSPSFINLREVSARFKLPPGTYCVVPSTFEPNEEGEFVLRIFSEKKSDVQELDDSIGITKPDAAAKTVSPAKGARQIPITVRARDEPNQDAKEAMRGVFQKISGDDMEIDPTELKEVLDLALRRGNVGALEPSPHATLLTQAPVPGNGATPVTDTQQQQQQPPGDNDVTVAACLAVLSCCWTSCLSCARLVEAGPADSDFQFDGFSLEICRSMVAMMDVDHSGKLGYEEFIELWRDILTWKNVFKSFDKDNSQFLTTFELRNALNSAGYRLNWHILKALVLRYGEKNSTISFDNFIMCAVKLKSMMELFKDKDPNGTNQASFSLEEWIEKTMYA